MRKGGKIKLCYANNKTIVWQCPRCGSSRLEENITAGIVMWD